MVRVDLKDKGVELITVNVSERRCLERSRRICSLIAKIDDQSLAHEALQQLCSHINPETGIYEVPSQEKPF